VSVPKWHFFLWLAPRETARGARGKPSFMGGEARAKTRRAFLSYTFFLTTVFVLEILFAHPACRSVCVALVAGAGRRCTYTVCTFYIPSHSSLFFL
jgi:hypothetical protein